MIGSVALQLSDLNWKQKQQQKVVVVVVVVVVGIMYLVAEKDVRACVCVRV